MIAIGIVRTIGAATSTETGTTGVMTGMKIARIATETGTGIVIMIAGELIDSFTSDGLSFGSGRCF